MSAPSVATQKAALRMGHQDLPLGDLADLEFADAGREGEVPTLQARDFGTDLDASLRFAADYVDRVRYVHGIGWHAWDGKRWREGQHGRVVELAKESARKWTLRCCRSNDENREKMIRAAMALENGSRVRAAVDLAKSDARLVLPVAELDRDPWMLNVENGTVDLRTGELRPHRREDMLTKLAPAYFDHEAQHPLLDRYLAGIEADTPGMTEFLARCFGAALTGDATTESLFLLQGDGGSGKTTLVEAAAAMLGDYSVKLAFESFCLSKHGRAPGAASPELVALRGARLAYASEGDQSARLDAGIVKMVTGNEPITARALYQPMITFPQTWKVWLVTNFDPKTDSEDSGIWRRMLKLHFHEIQKAERDPAVKIALGRDPAARSALLAWCIAGCLDWQKRGGGRIGLAPPSGVESVTEDYRREQDPMAQWWVDLLCVATLSPAAFTTSATLRQNYEKWCSENGACPVHQRRFARYLEGKKLESERRGGARGWRGIRLDAA